MCSRRVFFCLTSPFPQKVQPKILDLEDIIKESVWDDVDYQVSCCADNQKCKRKNLELKVDWRYMSRVDKVVRFAIRHDLTDNTPQNIILFETMFENKSDEAQQFTFKTSRQTTSNFEISVQEGLSIGGNFDFKFSLGKPDGLCSKDGEENEASSTVGGHVTWTGTKNEKLTKGETLTWGVDSQVTVPKLTTVIASLGLREIHYVADLDIETTVTVTSASQLIPVDVYSKKDNELTEILDVSCNQLCKDNSCLIYDKNHPNSFKYKTTAVCAAVYGVEQRVSILPWKLKSSSGATLSALPFNTTEEYSSNVPSTRNTPLITASS